MVPRYSTTMKKTCREDGGKNTERTFRRREKGRETEKALVWTDRYHKGKIKGCCNPK